MKPTQSFELVARTMVLRSDKPNKGVTAIPAANPHQMNRVRGFTLGGTEVIVAKREGKAGMEFSKLLGGKTYAIAADACAAVYEKDEVGKPTRVQKKEDGVPLFSASGFYLLSSKEYPAVDLSRALVHLPDGATDQMLVLAEDAVPHRESVEDEMALDLFQVRLLQQLDDARNPLRAHVQAANRARKRGIDAAIAEAEDADSPYGGVTYTELPLSPKDGNPFVFIQARSGAEMRSHLLARDALDDVGGKSVRRFFSAKDAVLQFLRTPFFAEISGWVAAGRVVELATYSGHSMRTSVTFKGKIQKEREAPGLYGDSPLIRGASTGWVKAIVTTMFSKHPGFPLQDYPDLHFVASARQAEMGLNRKGSGWAPPQPLVYVPDAFAETTAPTAAAGASA